MMKDILIETDSGQTRLALIEDGELSEYYIERKGQEKLAGNIYLGRVANVLQGMQAAFVDIGLEKNAFLHVNDILDFGDKDGLRQRISNQPPQTRIRAGQELLVQVVKEPGGTKGPRISSHITLPSRLVVLLPTVEYVGISRRIEDEEERLRLRMLAEALRPNGMGVIVRTAANGAKEDEIRRDIEYLIRMWSVILQRGEHSTSPALIHRDESLVYRSVRDMLTEEVRTILVDNAEQYSSVHEIAGMLSPELQTRVQLYEGETPLFDRYRVDAHFSKALARRVWLKSGGYLVIDHTEALTVIDVNTGKFVGSNSLADTVLKLNCEAAAEIVRQLRLRDVGGIVIIDFIDMESEEDQLQLLSQLRQLLKKDRTKTNLVGLTGLGLVEMTRKKVRQPIYTQLQRQCPLCQGSGMVDSDETVARSILHELRARTALSPETQGWLVRASSGVSGQLVLIGASAGVHAFVCADHVLSADKYSIEPTCENMLPPKTRPIPQYT